MVIAALIVLGLCLGSFANAFVWRLHETEELRQKAQALESTGVGREAELRRLRARLREMSIVRGRSMCPHCRHELSALDLVPVVSYAWLRGRCRYCRQPIPDTPLAEVLLPVLFVVSYVFWPRTLWLSGTAHGYMWAWLGLWLVFLTGFVVLALYDLRWYLLPDRVVWPLMALAAAQVAVGGLAGGGAMAAAGAVWGVLIASGIFWVLYMVSRGKWIGGGDVKLGAVLGLLVGGPGNALLLLFLASLFGTLVAVPLLATGRASRGTRLPFGPFLILAGVVVYLFGAGIVRWYSRALLI